MTYDNEQHEIKVNHIGLVICPSCKGVGRFYSWDGCTGVSCQYCNGRGEVLEPSYTCLSISHCPALLSNSLYNNDRRFMSLSAQRRSEEMTTEVVNAVIESASITSGDHGCLSAWLTLKYATGGQGFGGYTLYLPKDCTHHQLQSVAGHFIWRCMEVAEVTEWDSLKGRCVRVRREVGWNGLIQAIGHIVNDDWFCPAEDFA